MSKVDPHEIAKEVIKLFNEWVLDLYSVVQEDKFNVFSVSV